MYWTLELASKLEDAPWPATKEELIDFSIRSGAPEARFLPGFFYFNNYTFLQQITVYHPFEKIDFCRKNPPKNK